MKKLSSSLAARMTPVTFLLTTIATLTLLLGSAQVGVAQTTVGSWSGQATNITTGNCSGANGLCQHASACNNGAGPNPDTILASVSLCEVSASTFVHFPDDPPSGSRVASGILTGSGTGTGFRVGATYISEIHFDNNTATCGTQPNIDLTSMVLGIWKVNPDGTAILTVDIPETGLSFSLNAYATVSVREIQPPNASCFNCTSNPVSQIVALRACGALTVVSTAGCTLPVNVR